MKDPHCELCRSAGGHPVIANEFLRVVLVDEADFPGFARVIWNDHVREMTELRAADRWRMMETVFAVEAAQREVLLPLKMNLASLGNATPHLHWHVIPRFGDDSRFPNPVWSAASRASSADALAQRRAKTSALRARIAECVARVAA